MCKKQIDLDDIRSTRNDPWPLLFQTVQIIDDEIDVALSRVAL